MLDIFKRPITIIIVIVAIIIAMVWSYVAKIAEQREAATSSSQIASTAINLTTIDASDYNELLSSELATATAKAIQADGQNKLSAVEIELPSLEINSGQTRYIFSSGQNKSENWLITFNQKSAAFLRARVPKEDYLGDIPAINTALWKFNYVTAIQIMEKNGGQAWRDINGMSSAKLTLRHGGKNNWLLWYIDYKSGEASYSKVIDANSGKIVTE